MKLSQFNNYVFTQENLFIYNSLKQGVLRLDGDYKKEIEAILESTEKASFLSKELRDNLSKGGMLIEDDADEIKYIEVANRIADYSNDVFTLTIAPTMKCNFRCPYCYEKNIEHKTMSDPVISKTIDFIEEIHKQYRFLNIAWYGGEPLLAIDIIKHISEKIIELFGTNYSSSLVTNGYLLSQELAMELERLKIKQIQVTIDGPPEVHNKLRKLPNNEDTFFKILSNVKQAIEITNEIVITIRVNTDKKNINSVSDILPYLQEFDINNNDRVHLYLAPVDNINNTCNPNECFSSSEFAEEQMKFISDNYAKGYNFVHLPKCNIGICGAVSLNSIIIDASGDFYKCWDDVGDKKENIGNVFEPLKLTTKLVKWLSYDYVDDECRSCSLLPVCMGGCPNSRLKTGKKTCISFKYHAKEMIELLYDLYKK